MAEPGSPPKQASSPAKEAPVDAAMLLLQGKRHLLVQDYPSAVCSLQEACERLGALYGETAPECGEAYLCYGKALLELARQETGVLGNALDSEEEEEEEEGDEEDGQEEKADEGDGDPAVEGAPSAEAEQKEEDAEEDLEKPEPALKDDIEPPPSEPGTSSGATASSSPKDEDEVSNLQLAWEVLELAKVIFTRQAEEGSREARLKVADVLLKLGEISIESDNCGQATEDLGECLRIQEELLEPDSRHVAETLYQRGLAHSFAGQYKAAADDFSAAVQVLELRVKNLTGFIEESKGKEREGSLDDDPVWRAEREVEELEGLLPEVKAKVEDTEETIRQDCSALKDAAIQKMMERLPSTSPVKNAASGSESSRPVNVITHLIKRKRPSGDNASSEGSSATPKKLKADCSEATNGDSAKPAVVEKPAAECIKTVSPLKSVVS